jgi:hypothetical protein
VRNKLIDAKEVINAQTLPKVQMPNRDGFIPRFPERMPPGQPERCGYVGDKLGERSLNGTRPAVAKAPIERQTGVIKKTAQ